MFQRLHDSGNFSDRPDDGVHDTVQSIDNLAEVAPVLADFDPDLQFAIDSGLGQVVGVPDT